ncbi:hypothetical protein QLX67_01180 [Balneolaceae bacterium ANBcel3]|nr:hypothetical protein [Balneolaceae bacterium ANBcel3]
MQKSRLFRIKILFPIYLLVVFFCSCSSASDVSLPASHDFKTPGEHIEVSYTPVYVESLSIAQLEGDSYLQVEGYLPTPCHHPAPFTAKRKEALLEITLFAWQDTEVMCAQALEPVTLYFKIPKKDRPEIITVNEVSITVN